MWSWGLEFQEEVWRFFDLTIDLVGTCGSLAHFCAFSLCNERIMPESSEKCPDAWRWQAPHKAVILSFRSWGITGSSFTVNRSKHLNNLKNLSNCTLPSCWCCKNHLVCVHSCFTGLSKVVLRCLRMCRCWQLWKLLWGICS